MERIELVKKWLDENVLVFKKVTLLELHAITFSLDVYQGSLVAYINDERVNFTFGANDCDGKIKVNGPIFVSPLGAPASYSAINLPNEYTKLIEKNLRECFPNLRPYGKNRETGIETDGLTPISQRIIDRDKVMKSIEAISKNDFFIKLI